MEVAKTMSLGYWGDIGAISLKILTREALFHIVFFRESL